MYLFELSSYDIIGMMREIDLLLALRAYRESLSEYRKYLRMKEIKNRFNMIRQNDYG